LGALSEAMDAGRGGLLGRSAGRGGLVPPVGRGTGAGRGGLMPASALVFGDGDGTGAGEGRGGLDPALQWLKYSPTL
jgi:hypothetical protein